MFSHFTPLQWTLAAVAAFCIGISKSGFSGAGLVTVLIMAQLFGDRQSTGALLPMLVFGDLLSVWAFHRHAQWPLIVRMLPSTVAGILLGYLMMRWLPAGAFRPIIGWIVLAMVVLQSIRRWKPVLFEAAPHTRTFALAMGLGSGVATMLANAAGPIMALYFLSIGIPKYHLVGTSAWFFLIVNVFKVPFSAQLGLIQGSSLAINLLLAPAILLGTFTGRRLMHVVSQDLFELLLLLFAAISSLRLIFW